MLIEKNKVVTFHYRLSEPGNEPFDDSRQENDPVVYLHGHQGMLRGLETALTGKQAGDSFTVTLPPEEAYGLRQAQEPHRVPIKYILNKGKLKPGMVVQISTKGGPRDATVIKVGRFNIDVDPNHPLAGKTLVFDVEVIDVRDAEAEEINHGHVHGAGGHQH